MRSGYTLVELCSALVLAALAGSAFLPRARDLRDGLAVVAAREAVAGLLAEARVHAVARGGATVHVRAEPWTAWAEVADSVVRSVALEEELGVTVVLSRGRAATELRYDALGLGQVASETLLFRRGDAGRALVVSGYGRVRRP